MQIHLVTKSGPEWNDPIKAFKVKKKAKKLADELNKKLDNKNVFDRLSNHIVIPIEYEE